MSSHSGKFVLRIPPALHKELATKARREGLSLNVFCLHLISTAMHRSLLTVPWKDKLETVVTYLKKYHGKALLGVIVFGSRVTGEATDDSDLDLLIVLDNRIPIRRGLYRGWDRDSPQIGVGLLDPHFTHLPNHVYEAGAVWLEAATSGEIVYDPQHRIQKILMTLQQPIASGTIRRGWSHGHPYWTRNDNEKP